MPMIVSLYQYSVYPFICTQYFYYEYPGIFSIIFSIIIITSKWQKVHDSKSTLWCSCCDYEWYSDQYSSNHMKYTETINKNLYYQSKLLHKTTTTLSQISFFSQSYYYIVHYPKPPIMHPYSLYIIILDIILYKILYKILAN